MQACVIMKLDCCCDHTYLHQATDRKLDLKGESLGVYKEIDERHVECFSENQGVASLWERLGCHLLHHPSFSISNVMSVKFIGFY